MNDILKTGDFESKEAFWTAARKFFGGVQDERIDRLRKAALTEGLDSGGGFTVPEEFGNDLLSAVMEGAIVRPRAVVLPMESDRIRVPILVDASRATSIFGGVTVSVVKEGGDLFASTSKPAVGALQLNAHKVVASCFVSDELAADGRAFVPFIESAFGAAVRFLEDDLFFWGTGKGEPLGVMNSPALVSVTRASMGKVDVADLGKMAARLSPGSWNNAVFVMNQTVLTEWFGLTGGSEIDMAELKILGRPILISEHCAALGTAGDVLLADFSQYIIGDRLFTVGASREATASSGTRGYLQGETAWRLIDRVDGQPMPAAPITPRHGGDTVSPFVALTTSS